MTYTDAIDEISALLNNAWNAGASDIVGYVPVIFWPGDNEPDTPDASKYWARFSIQSVGETQTSLANPAKRFTPFGLIFVQLFGVKGDVSQTYKIRKLAELAKGAYRGQGTKGAVWFKNVRINELSPERGMARINVVAEYEYDEFTG